MIPSALRSALLLMFALDALCAVLLLLYPKEMLLCAGSSQAVPLDPTMARLVGAALFAQAGASVLHTPLRKESLLLVLRLRLLWTGAGVFALILSLDEGAPARLWFVLVGLLIQSVISLYALQSVLSAAPSLRVRDPI
jgi:hypothetical protein